MSHNESNQDNESQLIKEQLDRMHKTAVGLKKDIEELEASQKDILASLQKLNMHLNAQNEQKALTMVSEEDRKLYLSLKEKQEEEGSRTASKAKAFRMSRSMRV